jgi:ParB family chromosome partitioning protein
MNIKMISLNKLVPSRNNVRKTGTSIGVDELAASIVAHGLLQNLQVRAVAKAKFEVIAGGRRLAALKLLAKRKAITKNAPVGCNVLDDEDAGEISLAENVVREPMHPADQFEAFKALAETGKGPEEIAARFGVTATVVRQRLKLASVSGKLIDLYRAGEMTLDQLMAFTVSDDQTAQEAAWETLTTFNCTPQAIRRVLTETQVEAEDARAAFVGLDVYRAAGGQIVRDLFQPEHEGYLADAALLDRLMMDRLQREAEAVRAEGWKWVEITPELNYAALRGFGRVEGERLALPPERVEERDRLAAEYESLIAEHGEDPEPEIAAQLEQLSERIDSLSEGEAVWPPEAKAHSGAILAIGHDGALRIERGLVRPEDRPSLEDSDDEPVTPARGRDAATTEAKCPLSARLIEDLTAQRTGALRALLAENPHVAVAATVHALASQIFYDSYHDEGTCLSIRAESTDLTSNADGIGDGPALTRLAEQRAHWARQLPQEPEQLWAWLLAQDTSTLLALLAVVSSFTVNAVRKPHERADDPRLAHADRLAVALSLDMAQWWQPTVASYLGRVSKALALDAVKEGVSSAAADNLSTLKKDALTARAAERLAGTGWLPAILRTPDTAQTEEALAAE